MRKQASRTKRGALGEPRVAAPQEPSIDEPVASLLTSPLACLLFAVFTWQPDSLSDSSNRNPDVIPPGFARTKTSRSI